VPPGGIFFLLVVLLFASLIGNAAGSLAGRLARGLALAAATILGALAEIAGSNGLNMLHCCFLHVLTFFYYMAFAAVCQEKEPSEKGPNKKE
jgi:hypothetical protein